MLRTQENQIKLLLYFPKMDTASARPRLPSMEAGNIKLYKVVQQSI